MEPANYPPRFRLEPIAPALLRVSLGHLVVAAIVWFWLATNDHRGTKNDILPPVELSGMINASSRESHSARLWFNPSDFRTPAALNLNNKPTGAADSLVPDAIGLPPTSPTFDLAPLPLPPAPSQAKSRIITLSRLPASISPLTQLPPTQELTASVAHAYALSGSGHASTAGVPPGRSPLLSADPATLAALDRLDEALYEAFMQAWQPPDPTSIPASKRAARLDVTLDHAITLVAFELSQPSGSTDLDLSIMQAADQVRDRLRLRHHRRDTLKFPQELPSTFQNSSYVCRIQFQIE